MHPDHRILNVKVTDIRGRKKGFKAKLGQFESAVFDTKTAAHEDLEQKLSLAMHGTYEPVFLEWRGQQRIIYRQPSDHVPEFWLVYDCNQKRTTGSFGTSDRAHVMQEVRMHLAQQAWEHKDGPAAPEILNGLPETAMGDWRTWTEFQIRFKEGRALGMNEHDAHGYAGRDPARPHLWHKAEVPAHG